MSIPDPLLIHGTAVALAGRALLMTGASGRGKSSLALQLIGLGAVLVADDQVAVRAIDGALRISKPATLPPMIEARGMGLLAVPTTPDATLHAIVDMDQTAAARMPAPQMRALLGLNATVIANAPSPHFPTALMLYLKGAALRQ